MNSKTKAVSKTLKQYPNYSITRSGTVRSVKTGNTLSPVLDTTFKTVRLTNANGQRVRVRVSSLVKEAFSGR